MAQEKVNEMLHEDITEMPHGDDNKKALGNVQEITADPKIEGPASHRVGQLDTDILSDLLNIKNQLNSMNELLKQIHRIVMRHAA